jgi:3-methyladenine DNA glycosylase/8-oxoguanine DNA glycosylase
MPTLTLKVPEDYVLARDVCSYGYFLLRPNYWDVRSRAFSAVLTLGNGASPRAVAAHITQRARGDSLKIMLSRTLSAGERGVLRERVVRMLRLDEGASTIAQYHEMDERQRGSGRGRLFRSPTLFEDVIKTVTSCNVTWPSTVHMNLRLCEVLGSPVSIGKEKRHAFPTAARVAKTLPTTLRARCRVGYRDVRIVELARLFETKPAHGGIDQEYLESPDTADQSVFEYLVELPGIGPYAAANIMQLLGRYTRLPLDSESLRHGKKVLEMKGTDASILKKMSKRFAPLGEHAFRAYWFELWEYYEKKAGPSDTWERDTTGRIFTAALLK